MLAMMECQSGERALQYRPTLIPPTIGMVTGNGVKVWIEEGGLAYGRAHLPRCENSNCGVLPTELLLDTVQSTRLRAP